ncbi:MAG TPA: HEAT repeat domain-containing protein [Desulfuromonadales bacterium]|nr:HEAT repeat domain-containing protein [Desulfuromonadales bacterium]
MTKHEPDKGTGVAEAARISALIVELNIARRNIRAYPAGHPQIDLSLRKALTAYSKLFDTQDEVTLAVTSDSLMLSGAVLEKSNLIFRNFARVLFERGIGAISFGSGVTNGELKNFMTLLGFKREDIHHRGGIMKVWELSGITSLSVQPVRYDLLRGTDEEFVGDGATAASPVSVWEQFAATITGHSGEVDFEYDGISPEQLADILNRQFIEDALQSDDFHEPVEVLMLHDSSLSQSSVPYDKLAAFAGHLNPELRRRFLSDSFELLSSVDQRGIDTLVSSLPDQVVLDTLDDISEGGMKVPPVIKGLLQRLGQQITARRLEEEEQEAAESSFADKVKTIFREHASEEFVPEDYQKKLDTIMASQSISGMQLDGIDALRASLESTAVENHIGDILMNLVWFGFESDEESDVLLQNLCDTFLYVAQTGDYVRLIGMLQQFGNDHCPPEVRERVTREFARPEFLEEIINGLTIWGKSRYDDIRSLIRIVGEPFIDVLIERLAEEKNMSLRRFYVDSLIEMGEMALMPIVSHLNDRRWYFQRNLLAVLAALDNPAAVSYIRPLLGNSDPRVSGEALRVLLHFKDQETEKLLVQELESQNRETRLLAVQHAGKCPHPEVVKRLLTILCSSGLSQSEYEMSSTVVQALGEIGRAEALPELARILASRSLLHARNLSRLKVDIVRSLEKYPLQLARPVLERLADSGNKDVAGQAAISLNSLPGHQL